MLNNMIVGRMDGLIFYRVVSHIQLIEWAMLDVVGPTHTLELFVHRLTYI